MTDGAKGWCRSCGAVVDGARNDRGRHRGGGGCWGDVYEFAGQTAEELHAAVKAAFDEGWADYVVGEAGLGPRVPNYAEAAGAPAPPARTGGAMMAAPPPDPTDLSADLDAEGADATPTAPDPGARAPPEATPTAPTPTRPPGATVILNFHWTPRDLYDALPFPEERRGGHRWKHYTVDNASAAWFPLGG
jgi:hypothetical protein